MVSIVKFIGMAAAIVAAQAKQEDKADLRVLGAMVGQDSLRTESSIELVTSREQWQSVWASHGGTKVLTSGRPPVPGHDAPNADFQKTVVLAVFVGEVSPARNVVVVGTKTDGDRHILRLDVQPLNPGVQLQTRPFAFFVLPRFQKKLDIEIPGRKDDGTPGWRVITSFPPLPSNSVKKSRE
jgi:hypothetical protein